MKKDAVKEVKEVTTKKVKEFGDNFFEIDNDNHLSGYEVFFIFMICNIIGYCVEMVFGKITNGYWESRQSLVFGPFGLAYGFGGVLLTYILYKDLHKPMWRVFLKSWIWGTVAEYVFSLGEELIFGHVSWDYSAMPLNINGRVCFLYSLFWGVLGLVWCKAIYPGFMKLIHALPIRPGKVVFWIVFVFMIIDILLSCEAANRFNQRKEGVPPDSKVDVIMDNYFPDDFMEYVYANAMDTSE